MEVTPSEIIKSFEENNNCIIGVCNASPIPANEQSSFVPFVTRNIKKRTDPSAILPGVRSVIAVSVPQCTGRIQKQCGNFPQLSSLGTNNDYHSKVKTLIGKLAAELTANTTQPPKFKVLVDSPTLDEKAFAQRAGIGFIGRSGLIITEKFGTRFNIGLLLTDLELCHTSHHRQSAVNTPVTCPPNCLLCINACPGNALQHNKPLNASRCISYLTQKKDLTKAEEEMIFQSGQLYGCDICQDVCPLNAPQTKTHINPNEWLAKSDESFAEEYGHTAMMWQGAEILRRNAAIFCKSQTFPDKNRI